MIWIAIDESGDLGFSERSSKYLVLAFTFTSNVYSVRKKLRRLLRKLVRRRMWPKEIDELKFSLSKTRLEAHGIEAGGFIEKLEQVRRLVLSTISELPVDIAVSIVEKRLVQDILRNNTDKLYNYVMVHPLIVRFIPKYNPPPFSRIIIILDKRLGSRAQVALENYISRKYDYMKNYEERIRYEASFELLQAPSYGEPLIWVSDYVAGSVNHYMTLGDDRYVSIIRRKLFDCLYFWNNPKVCDEVLGRI